MRSVLFVWLLCACSPATIEQQHSIALSRHTYITDQKQYGKKDVWTPSLKGDCEDYALWMRERVGGNILLVVTEDGQYHAVLDVDGKIVDNLSSHVYPKSLMRHKIIVELNDEQLQQMIDGNPVPSK